MATAREVLQEGIEPSTFPMSRERSTSELLEHVRVLYSWRNDLPGVLSIRTQCRPSGSNRDVPVFSGVHEPSLLERHTAVRTGIEPVKAPVTGECGHQLAHEPTGRCTGLEPVS